MRHRPSAFPALLPMMIAGQAPVDPTRPVRDLGRRAELGDLPAKIAAKAKS